MRNLSISFRRRQVAEQQCGGGCDSFSLSRSADSHKGTALRGIASHQHSWRSVQNVQARQAGSQPAKAQCAGSCRPMA
jgi:hypothetical protein